MDYRDPRLAKTVWLFALTVCAINMGMALGRFDDNLGKTSTLIALIFAALAVSAFLFLLIRDLWKRDA